MQLAIYNHGSVNPLDLRPEQIHIEWIANRLAGIRRFGGDGPSTVLEHSLMVARRAMAKTKTEELSCVVGMQALLHDAAEALLCDIPRPLKESMAFRVGGDFVSYAEIEGRVLGRILRRYDLPVDLLPQVTEADDAECLRELTAYHKGERTWTEHVSVQTFIAFFRMLQAHRMELEKARVVV